MNTNFAIELLEELGSSQDTIELVGKTKKQWDFYEFPLPEEPVDLDVNIENDATKIRIQYSSMTKNKTVKGTLSGMVMDRLNGGSETKIQKELIRNWIDMGEICTQYCSAERNCNAW